ncbi:BolA/IbaG family iron-sulfur metabolism protein [Marinobacter adhaerens]|uniref:BolA/IbaG family iron-sulfur metabolism protein n=1 Tax=Marinobacter adhaerens TaxID=1033846 RepID=A0A851HWI0_9GAMM|nr:BolA/IbaG family iron-sulfur metabolism protein [Marinobacter adhaerens]NWN91335.1 BolA/IbaG family iron-sulfur metabolism protein [Marinobacter adhaerens]
MDTAEVTQLVKEALPECEVQVQIDGNHYLVVVIGDVFEGLSTIKRQQLINKALFQQLMDGTIHALHPRAFTPAEWAARQG